MNEVGSDRELVNQFSDVRSEAAFRALIARHLDLVYATALRQVGDAGIAEEIAQNVFVALSRKAPRLGRIETLAGWLHRCAILESKRRIRSELRRKQREQTAAEISLLERQGDSTVAALIPILDEALLNLRENDRLAVVLRFLEGHTIREVGATLGIDEEAARKRIARALDRMTEFFRRRGFAVSSGAAAALVSDSAHAAPAGLAAAVGNAGLAATGSCGSINLIVTHLMTLTKTQTAAICLVIAVAPMVWQQRSKAEADQQRSQAAVQFAAAELRLADLEQNLRGTREAVQRVQAEAIGSETQLAGLVAQQRSDPPQLYAWRDESPLVRVPKTVANTLNISAVSNKRGRLSDQAREILQMSDTEAGQVQGALDRFIGQYWTAQAQMMQSVEPTERDLEERTPEEVRVFRLEPVGEILVGIRGELFQQLESILGDDRFRLFQHALNNWMPVDDEFGGLNSGMAVYNTEHRVAFRRPKAGDRRLGWSIASEHGSISASMNIDEIPDLYRRELADWIALALSQPAPAK